MTRWPKNRVPFLFAVPSQEEFRNPIPLDDEETVQAAERLREELSTASQPVLAGRQQSALVNTSVFGRDRGMSYTQEGYQRLDSILPKQGGGPVCRRWAGLTGLVQNMAGLSMPE
jgi:hypothetical protein